MSEGGRSASGALNMTEDQDPAGPDLGQGDAGPGQAAVPHVPPVQDDTTQLSVGIDIGSASTQIVFSRLRLERPSEAPTGPSFVAGHEPVYQSPVVLTPYLTEERIDGHAIGRLIDEAYTLADIDPDTVDTGAVILTGEAQRRENTKAIADALGERGDRFLWVAAGHHTEAKLAAYGSGAAAASHACGAPVLNIDIGGSTTKLTLVQGGDILHTAAMDLGGRLAVLDGEARLTRLDPAGERLAAFAGCAWSVGKTVREHDV